MIPHVWHAKHNRCSPAHELKACQSCHCTHKNVQAAHTAGPNDAQTASASPSDIRLPSRILPNSACANTSSSRSAGIVCMTTGTTWSKVASAKSGCFTRCCKCRGLRAAVLAALTFPTRSYTRTFAVMYRLPKDLGPSSLCRAWGSHCSSSAASGKKGRCELLQEQKWLDSNGNQ
jgi:hypothetical protein